MRVNKLKVEFDEPNVGGIWLTLKYGAETVNISATYIYNSFFPLVEALYRLKNAPGEGTVVWQCEPSEYEFQFSRQNLTISLQVLLFPDSSRSIFDKQEPKLSITGSYNEVCLPFWRALRQLQGRYSDDEWEVRWQSPFPRRELDLLTVALGK
jgi:hypothetical protein